MFGIEMSPWVFYSLIGAAIVAVLAVFYVIFEPNKWVSKHTVQGQKFRFQVKKSYLFAGKVLFNLLAKIPIMGIYLKNLCKMFKDMYIIDEGAAKAKVSVVLLIDCIMGVIAAFGSYPIFKDTFLTVIFTYMIVNYTHVKLIGNGMKFLKELVDSMGDMVHMYNAEGQNIDRMFIRMLNIDSIITPYLEQMYGYLKRAILNTDDESIIAEYNRIAPSRHLRLIFNYLFITYRYGDEYNESGEQLFNKNLLALQREAKADLDKAKSIKDETIGEVWFIICSIMMIPAAEWYMMNFFTFDGFETIGRFLSSDMGHAFKLAAATFSLICFFVYQKLLSSSMALEFKKDISWEELVLKQFPWIGRFLDKLKPKEGTKKHSRLTTSIAITEGYVGLRPLYLQKVICAISALVLVTLLISMDLWTSYSAIAQDAYRGVNSELMDIVANYQSDPEAYKRESVVNDMVVMDFLRERKSEYYALDTTPLREEFIQKIIKEEGIDYGLYPEVAAKRINEKFILIGERNYTVPIIIVIVAGLLGYFLPNFGIKLKHMLNRGVIIYDEVIGYHTVVILLMRHSAANIYMLLEWLTSFASVFKYRFQECIDHLNSESIRQLSSEVNYKELERLVECICLAYEGASLDVAFAGIEQRYMFQEESRKDTNELVVRKRVSMSQTLSWAAMGVAFALYVFAPMLMAIAEMLLKVVTI